MEEGEVVKKFKEGVKMAKEGYFLLPTKGKISYSHAEIVMYPHIEFGPLPRKRHIIVHFLYTLIIRQYHTKIAVNIE